MQIDWGALLPAEPEPAPAFVSTLQTCAPGAAVNDGGMGADREALEERAAIIECYAGKDRLTGEGMTSAEGLSREQVATWAARAGDDRRYCPECGHYRVSLCTIAKPGGLVSARRNYEPVAGIPRRCEGFAPLPADPINGRARSDGPGLYAMNR